MEHTHYMMNASVRSVYENTIRKSELPQTVQSLHGGRMQNLKLRAREALISIEDCANSP